MYTDLRIRLLRLERRLRAVIDLDADVNRRRKRLHARLTRLASPADRAASRERSADHVAPHAR